MSIRLYREDDAQSIVALLNDSVKELAGAFYSSEQVTAWLDALPDLDRIHRTRRDGRTTFLSVSGHGEVQAFTDIEPDGHIDFLYVTSAMVGQGVASRLYDHLETFAFQKNIKRLYTEASEHACRFFLKKGFRQLERREFEIGNTLIHNFAMEKILEF